MGRECLVCPETEAGDLVLLRPTQPGGSSGKKWHDDDDDGRWEMG